MLEYKTVENQASNWSRDISLSPHARKLAENLAVLANILIDPRYGCQSEHEAAAIFYCCLCRTIESKHCQLCLSLTIGKLPTCAALGNGSDF